MAPAGEDVPPRWVSPLRSLTSCSSMSPEWAAPPVGWRSHTPLPLLELGAHRGGYLPYGQSLRAAPCPLRGPLRMQAEPDLRPLLVMIAPAVACYFICLEVLKGAFPSGWPGLGWLGGSPWAPRSQASFGSLFARLRSSCICKGVGWPGFCMRIIRLTFVPSVTESATPLPNDFANESALPGQPVSIRKAKGG